jgi:RimJ/RimL family protein N-acetyltransferase
MFYQKIITPEEQVTWFNNLNKTHDFYFIIEVKGKKVGLIHGTIHSYKKKSAEGGIFIWDDSYLNSHVPVCASICMADLTFLIMGLEKTLAQVRSDNKTAINYNKSLGYKEVKEENGRIDMVLFKDDFLSENNKIRAKILAIHGEEIGLSWDDISLSSEYLDDEYEMMPEHIKKEIQNKFQTS